MSDEVTSPNPTAVHQWDVIAPPIVSAETGQAAAAQAFRDGLPGGIKKAVMAGHAAYRAVVELGAEPGLAIKAALLLTSGEERPYRTSADACSCAWAWYHPGQACKHSLALRLGQAAEGTKP
jgi:hypothetical protein